jgi:plasmid stabilization system protein ParE
MQKDAYDWYESQKVGLGELFLTELDRNYQRLQTFPTAYSKRESRYRHSKLKRFPYIVVFKIIKTQIVVYAVFHTSRDPNNRLK